MIKYIILWEVGDVYKEGKVSCKNKALLRSGFDQGAYRCTALWKSVLLTQIEEELRDAGYDEEHIIKINFEDLRFEKIRNEERLNKYVTDQIKDDKRYLIFLDEIQHVRNFEKVLSSLRATVNCSIFVTGSNSKLLSGKMATLLVGRCIEYRIMPFSFSECYEF